MQLQFFRRAYSSARRGPYIGSLNQIVFEHAPIRSELRPSLFTVFGVTALIKIASHSSSLLRIRAKLPEFRKAPFLADSSKMKDLAHLRRITSQRLFSSLKNKLGSTAVHVASVESVRPAVVDAAYCQIRAGEPIEVAQILLRFTRADAAPEFIVFERCLSTPTSAWRIAGRVEESDKYFQE